MGSTVPISQQELVSLGANSLKTSCEETTYFCPLSDAPCDFQAWAEATCPSQWRFPHWSHRDKHPHLHIRSLPTAKTVCPYSYGSELSPFPLQIGLYFLPEHSTKCGRIGCLGQHKQATEGRWQMPWPGVHMCPCIWSWHLCDESLSQFQLHLGHRPYLSYLPGALLCNSLNSTVFQFTCKLLTTESCYLPTEQLHICQSEHSPSAHRD